MAVYERAYKPYEGDLTPAWSRFLILPRYTLQRVFAARLTLAFFVACLLPHLSGLIIIYVVNSLAILKKLGPLGEFVRQLDFVNPANFLGFMVFIGMFLGFILVLIAGPTLISRDMTHNGLPLYLSRPFSRREYVLGKLSVLVLLLSAITWVPGLILFAVQSILAGGSWMVDNFRIAVGVFVGSWAWILTISLICLAISASVKRRVTATLYMFALFLLLPTIGAVIMAQGMWWGEMLILTQMVHQVWAWLYGVPLPSGNVPVWAAWLTLFLWCGLSLWILRRRVRAYEIIK